MSYHEEQEAKKRERKAKGKVAPSQRRKTRGDGGVADWATVDSTLIAKAVAAIGSNGGALRLGYTSDGGAYAVGFYGDGDPFTEYLSPKEDINEFLKGIIEDYGN